MIGDDVRISRTVYVGDLIDHFLNRYSDLLYT